MSAAQNSTAVSAAGAAVGEAIGIFMLHPETFAGSMAAGYANPMAGYVAGRGGVLGEASGGTVAAVFAVFEPTTLGALWAEGVAVRGATGAADVYWEQMAEFGRRYLSGVDGVGRLAELGQRVIAATPTPGLPMFAGWREMPLAGPGTTDDPARALQVMHVLRELRGDVHFNALSLSGVSPVEAHMISHDDETYTRMFGWSEPFDHGADKKDRYAAAEELTNRRMTELFEAALSSDEIAEFARLTEGALSALKAAATSS
jgi:hypothetical protein